MVRNRVHHNSHSTSSGSHSNGSSSHSAGSSSNSSHSIQQSQQQAAQRAREEAARRAAVQQQINTKNGQITQLNGILSELQTEKAGMESSIQKWKNARQIFLQADITCVGEVKNIFEGQAAGTVKQQNDSKIISMDAKVSSATVIKNSVSGQENRGRTKISRLSTEIATLRSQL